MERVKKGEKYHFISKITLKEDVGLMIESYGVTDTYSFIDTKRFNMGNYFHSRDELEKMIDKIYAVLKGADVIEMPSDINICDTNNNNSEYEFGISIGWQKCYNWIKSKIVK